MKREAIRHIPMSQDAHAVNEKRMVFRIRAAIDDLEECILHYGDRSCRQTPVIFHSIPMERVNRDMSFDFYEIEFDVPYRRICYFFELISGAVTTYYYGYFFHDGLVDDRSEYFQFPYIHREDIARVPDWVYDAVVYQIFPDSFATSRRFISGGASETYYQGYPVKGKLGGTLQGITENVDYLTNLGINCIYINPMFTAGEYHKYDIMDYFSVDPVFGTNADFLRLVDVMHENGIRVIIDGVFNHCGWNFFAFEDVIKNGKNSKYADWFYRLGYPVVKPDNMEEIPVYECFGYERMMPKLNTAHPDVQRYFCEVCRHWLEQYHIDGWRLDVADEVNDEFWRAFRKTAKASNPECVLIGEVWINASHWLDGSMFDSTMNYDLRRHSRRFFAEGSIDAAEFNSRVIDMLMRYQKNCLPAQLNLLDSHDVSRFLSLCGEDERKLKLAVLFQMSFCGMPGILYGDEQGFCGIAEEDYRQPMQWGEEHSLFGFYQSLIVLRKKYNALKRGGFRTLDAEDGSRIYVYVRQYFDEKITIALNCSEEPAVWTPPSGSVLLGDYEGQELPGLGYCMILGDGGDNHVNHNQ